MGRCDNLIPLSRRPKEEARRIQSAGGVRSGEVRREKRRMRECLNLLLSLPAREAGELAELGVSDADNTMALMAALYKKALGGDVSAIREVRAIAGDEAFSQADGGGFELPARCVAAGYVDLYRDIRAGRHTEYVLYGGRGSAKSSFVSMVILDLLVKFSNMHAVVCRRVKETLRDSVYAQMLWAISEVGLEDEFEARVSPLEIVRRATGQKIFFRGADDEAKLKSIKPPFGYVGVLWFEELDQFSGEEQVRSIEQSVIRGGDRAFIFKSFNPPKSAMSWANRYVETPKESRLCHKSTYLDVPEEWLGRAFLDEAEFLKGARPEAYEHEYLGVANGAGGQVFDNLLLRKVDDEEIERFDRVYMGVDWGYYPDPFAWNRMYYHAARRELVIFDELTLFKTSNRDAAKKLLEDKGVGPDELVVADSAEPKSVGDFRDLGIKCRGAVKGPGSVEYSMKWLQGLGRIVIDPGRCPDTAREFSEYEYERSPDGAVVSGYPDAKNHHIDAVRYGMSTVWRRRGK